MERQENFPLLEKLPDRETRVIGVINKCDTKQKKSHEWVYSCPNADRNIGLMNLRSLILSGMIPNLNITSERVGTVYEIAKLPNWRLVTTNETRMRIPSSLDKNGRLLTLRNSEDITSRKLLFKCAIGMLSKASRGFCVLFKSNWTTVIRKSTDLANHAPTTKLSSPLSTGLLHGTLPWLKAH
jgi:hypothetical protein